ncbi:collagen alpha-1(I) chain-like [Ornithorhynchus anatinus]|uniref:collagen alpha-1(I) chain-like n=1 Tax=Ornithorhynchus anatinus TaxID=9258 RepID=UPI0010A7590A|nr:collagen alpha-1(I) chain-like [Ornithorhynchus anatinus]
MAPKYFKGSMTNQSHDRLNPDHGHQQNRSYRRSTGDLRLPSSRRARLGRLTSGAPHEAANGGNPKNPPTADGPSAGRGHAPPRRSAGLSFTSPSEIRPASPRGERSSRPRTKFGRPSREEGRAARHPTTEGCPEGDLTPPDIRLRPEATQGSRTHLRRHPKPRNDRLSLRQHAPQQKKGPRGIFPLGAAPGNQGRSGVSASRRPNPTGPRGPSSAETPSTRPRLPARDLSPPPSPTGTGSPHLPLDVHSSRRRVDGAEGGAGPSPSESRGPTRRPVPRTRPGPPGPAVGSRDPGPILQRGVAVASAGGHRWPDRVSPHPSVTAKLHKGAFYATGGGEGGAWRPGRGPLLAFPGDGGRAPGGQGFREGKGGPVLRAWPVPEARSGGGRSGGPGGRGGGGGRLGPDPRRHSNPPGGRRVWSSGADTERSAAVVRRRRVPPPGPAPSPLPPPGPAPSPAPPAGRAERRPGHSGGHSGGHSRGAQPWGGRPGRTSGGRGSRGPPISPRLPRPGPTTTCSQRPRRHRPPPHGPAGGGYKSVPSASQQLAAAARSPQPAAAAAAAAPAPHIQTSSPGKPRPGGSLPRTLRGPAQVPGTDGGAAMNMRHRLHEPPPPPPPLPLLLLPWLPEEGRRCDGESGAEERGPGDGAVERGAGDETEQKTERSGAEQSAPTSLPRPARSLARRIRRVPGRPAPPRPEELRTDPAPTAADRTGPDRTGWGPAAGRHREQPP